MNILDICLETHLKKMMDKSIRSLMEPNWKSISGPIAGIFMIWFEEEFVFNTANDFLPFLKSWVRYRDDIYIVWSGRAETLDCFFWQLRLNLPLI